MPRPSFPIPVPSRLRRGRSVLAAVLGAAALLTAGLVAAPAPALAADCTNPLAPTGGFTVFVNGDTSLGNVETEGTIATHGALTWLKDYPVVHSTGLTPRGYALPTVAGHPTRVAAGTASIAGSGGVLKVVSSGTVTDDQRGYLAVGDAAASYGYAFARSGGAEVVLAAVNDQNAASHIQITGPLIANPVAPATDANATAWAQANVDVGTPVVDALFAGFSTMTTSSSTAADLSTSTDAGVHQVTLEPGSDMGKRNVTLVGGVVNVLTVSAVDLGPSDNWTLTFAGAVQPSATTTFVVNLTTGAGTSFRLPQFSALSSPNETNPNAYAPYVLWNYPGTTPIEVTGNLISGSLLVPNATLTTKNASPIEGQIVAKSLVTSPGSGEIHHYAFAGCISGAAVAAAGGFSAHKVVSGVPVASLPVGGATTFTVDYFLNGATSAAGTLQLRADGTVVNGPQDLAVGTVVTFGERGLPVVAGGSWGTPMFSPSSVTVADGQDVAVTVTNTFTAASTGDAGAVDDTGDGTPAGQDDADVLAATGASGSVSVALVALAALLLGAAGVALRRTGALRSAARG